MLEIVDAHHHFWDDMKYPVDSLCASFDGIYRGFDATVCDFSVDEQRAFFGGNARRLYAVAG